MPRCDWCGTDPLYVNYHDFEWGVPEYCSRALWEKLVLDGFQAGLSWLTILKKRDNFRKAFEGFNPYKVAEFTDKDVDILMQNNGIVRNRSKIISTIKSAQIWKDIDSSIGFNNYIWAFVDGYPVQGKFTTMAEVPKFTDLSIKISNDLKAHGFKFCGPTITYAWMEACGLVNNHLIHCPCHEKVKSMVIKN